MGQVSMIKVLQPHLGRAVVLVLAGQSVLSVSNSASKVSGGVRENLSRTRKNMTVGPLRRLSSSLGSGNRKWGPVD